MASVLVEMSSISSPVSLTNAGSTLRVNAGDVLSSTPHLCRHTTLQGGGGQGGRGRGEEGEGEGGV